MPAWEERGQAQLTAPLPSPAGDLRLLRLHLAAVPLRLPGRLRGGPVRVHGGGGQQDGGAQSRWDMQAALGGGFLGAGAAFMECLLCAQLCLDLPAGLRPPGTHLSEGEAACPLALLSQPNVSHTCPAPCARPPCTLHPAPALCSAPTLPRGTKQPTMSGRLSSGSCCPHSGTWRCHQPCVKHTAHPLPLGLVGKGSQVLGLPESVLSPINALSRTSVLCRPHCESQCYHRPPPPRCGPRVHIHTWHISWCPDNRPGVPLPCLEGPPTTPREAAGSLPLALLPH